MIKMIPDLHRVTRVRRETADTFTLELEPAKGAPVSRFAAGQFNMLYAFGNGEVPISISGSPLAPSPLLHTVRAVGAVTQALIKLVPGSTVGVRGPFGTNWPLDEAEGKDVVIVAGGIGLAPLRPAIYQIVARRERYGQVALCYGARTPKEMLYPNELRRWRSRFDMFVALTVDNAAANWRGSVGVVTRMIPRADFDPLHTVALVCGPEIMMRYSVKALMDRGLEPDDIYVSLERNMKCAIGLCGHCQLGAEFVCKNGPVFRYSRVGNELNIREM